MTTDALLLAALASAAVPGLRPVRAEATVPVPGESHQVGYIEDVERRRWIVRLPRDAVASARQDSTTRLLALLSRRLPFAVPAPKGFASLPDGRHAMVYPQITGHPLRLAEIPTGPGLAAELGRALAALHNLDHRLYEEAGMPIYDAEQSRHRHLVHLDRAAATGRVPVGLLTRWERLLDDISLWRFAPTPIHGRFDGAHLLATFSSEDDACSGRIRAVLGWEDARVGDPAEDIAELAATAPDPTVSTVLQAYAMSRLVHPDPHLERRARLAAELRHITALLTALTGRDQHAIDHAVHALKDLDNQVGHDTVLQARPGVTFDHQPVDPTPDSEPAPRPESSAPPPTPVSEPEQAAAEPDDTGTVETLYTAAPKTDPSPLPTPTNDTFAEDTASTDDDKPHIAASDAITEPLPVVAGSGAH
ncbi:phosphotransferase [Austwickia sp. TVS 96-490-7B]|uniref:phosphotransferase n=1 Tax=Austwickia sp. TVS 96-490-7B TaxID=2830843 RepID=UPI001C566677|nr:phosphotransferase [Austwickia sp. TVS 96-490-7B]